MKGAQCKHILNYMCQLRFFKVGQHALQVLGTYIQITQQLDPPDPTDPPDPADPTIASVLCTLPGEIGFIIGALRNPPQIHGFSQEKSFEVSQIGGGTKVNSCTRSR